MIVKEVNPVADAVLPISEFRDHLQLGRGFSDDGAQDAVLMAQLRAAIAAIEDDTGKALFQREFLLKIAAWRDDAGQLLPRAPAVVISAFDIVDRVGDREAIDSGRYGLRGDAHEPVLCTTGWSLPTIPVAGHAEIVFEAGYGAAWAEFPASLRHSVLILAAHFYEHRSGSGERKYLMPKEVGALLRPYRPVRLFKRREI